MAMKLYYGNEEKNDHSITLGDSIYRDEIMKENSQSKGLFQDLLCT